MKTYQIIGLYGSQGLSSTVYVYEKSNGLKWYAVDGSVNVNATYDEIEEQTNVEYLTDVDFFTWKEEIEDINDLIKAVEA